MRPTGEFRSEFVVERGSSKRVLDSNRVVARDDKNQPEFLIALFDDVTDRRSLSEELENTKKFLELIVDNIPVSLIVESVSDGRYLLANRSAETILNRRREDATGLTAADIFNPREAKLIIARDEAAIRKRGLLTEEHPISTKDGLRLFLTRRMTVLDDAGEPQYLIKTHEDVTDRRQTESRMAHMAYHDGLTDLPNRAAFLQALAQMIEACDGTEEEFAVLSVDLDGLKEINDVFGHAIGDKLLIEVSRRLQASARGGVVARLSGDEFGLIIDGKQPVAGMLLAEKLAEALANEFMIDGKSVRTGVTTGISIFPHNGADAASLLANAGAALFRAKAKSRGSISIYEPEMDQQIRDRRVLHQDLSLAIKNGELSLYYQPQAMSRQTVASSEIIGFEALARWLHPVRGFVPPGDFIPLAEESGLIVEMGEWILREACREAASWAMPLQVAVNLSPAQFMHGDLVGLVHSILLETGLAPGRLELEITEGVLIEDFDRGLALLRRLKALGVRISMDDFGSGYSSLSYLQAFPFDKIKIDRAFVMNLGRNPQSAAIVRAVIGLGHGLEMSIVAEGVETQEQLGFLADEGCDAVQGYFIGKPLPIGQYAALVGRDRRQRRGARAQDRLGLVRSDAFFPCANRYPSRIKCGTGVARKRYSLRMADYDLAVIGGGLNGVSVARDAAGRGLRVIVLEQGDLGAAASSATPRLIHGDLALLERRAFSRVRTALAERDVWLRIAPHLVRPMRFSVPAHSDERPSWLLRLGLLLYDRLASRVQLPASATIDVTHHPVGNALKRPFGTAFEYSDCVVDDSRLVIANAVDAAERGAVIRTGARCVRADRADTWRLAVIDRGHRQVITARALANATGAWTASVAETVLRMPPPDVGTTQVSQIVVRRLFDTDNVYVFQNSDRRLIFASPYQRDFTLIGTVGRTFKGDPAVVSMTAGEVAYLCDAANRYFRERVDPSDVIRTVSGANAVMHPPASAPRAMARWRSMQGAARRRC